MSTIKPDIAAFTARVDQWITWDWECVRVDRAVLMLAAALADEIEDLGNDDGPVWRFRLGDEWDEWWAEDGWDEDDARRLLRLIGERWATGTLPEPSGG